MTEGRREPIEFAEYRRSLTVDRRGLLQEYKEAINIIAEARAVDCIGAVGLAGGLAVDQVLARALPKGNMIRKIGRAGTFGVMALSAMMIYAGVDRERYTRKAINVMREVSRGK